jgi:hypothetical protein
MNDGASETKTTTTRHIGNCQVCEADQKLHSGMLVLHGYQRPGDGYAHGRCPGVDAAPYEVSCELVKSYLLQVRASLVQAEAHIAFLASDAVLVLSKEVYRGFGLHEVEIKKSEAAAYAWDELLRTHKYNAENRVRMIKEDIKRLEKRIADWKPLPIRTVEEEQRKEQAKREAAAAEKKAKRAAKDKAAADRAAKAEANKETLRATILDFGNQFSALAKRVPAAKGTICAEAQALAKKSRGTKAQRFGGFYPNEMECDTALIHLGLARRVPADKATGREEYVDYSALFACA